MRTFIFCLLLIVSLLKISAHGSSTGHWVGQMQESNRALFDSIYYDIYVNVSGRDMNRALFLADSLYQHTPGTLYKIESLMLLAELYQQKGEKNKAVEMAKDARAQAAKAGFPDWEARALGFLSSQYRMAGLLEQSKKYLTEGLKVSDKIKDAEFSNHYRAIAYQEMAYFATEVDKDYTEAIRILRDADSLFQRLRIERNRDYFVASNAELIAKSYRNMQQYDSAFHYYHYALHYINETGQQGTLLEGIVAHGFGKLYMEMGEYSPAGEEFTKALAIAESSQHSYLQEITYEALADYHEVSGDDSEAAHFRAKYARKARENTEHNRIVLDNTLSDIFDDLQRASKGYTLFVIISTSLLLLIILLYFCYLLKQKAQYRRYQKILDELKKKLEPVATTQPSVIPPSGVDKISSDEDDFPDLVVPQRKRGNDQLLPPDTEKKLLQKLEAFEYSKKFTEKGLLLSSLAGKMNTNTKYLSHLISVHRQQDFNNYINELRIGYILDKLMEDERYLSFKISYLAEVSGFSSHSKFATVFKNRTGVKPSVFIEYLKKDKAQ